MKNGGAGMRAGSILYEVLAEKRPPGEADIGAQPGSR